MDGGKIMKVIVDNRERSIMQLLDQRSERMVYEARQLEVADVVVSEDVAIERKTGLDFITSIKDGRLFEQLLRLVDCYPIPVLIVEGLDDEVFENTGMNLSSIYGALVYIACRMGVAVIPTRHIEDTLIVIERLAYREQIEDTKPVLSRRTRKGMGVQERREFMLESLIDIGPKKAKTLIEEFETPFKVVEAIKDSKIIFTRTGKPKGIKGPLAGLKGFGYKFVEKNKELLFGKDE